MKIFNLFRNRNSVAPVTEGTKTTQVEPATPVKLKRDYKSAPGHYKPKSEFVRLDNVAAAAGVNYSTALKGVTALGIIKTHEYISNADAIKLHAYLWNEKA